MNNILNIVKADYLQRTRSYAFLITLAVSLILAYSFVPGPDANYTTLRFGNYTGVYNSAWIGYVSALMASLFLSLIGFFLVNNSISRDISTRVGMIIATTQISNFKYLLSKTISNFFVLLTIVFVSFLMSIAIYFFRGSQYSFEIMQFIIPYLLITIPSIFFISALATSAEVFLKSNTVIQGILFFIFFNFILINSTGPEKEKSSMYLDAFGINTTTSKIQEYVIKTYKIESGNMSMGYIVNYKYKRETFEFKGIQWPIEFVFNRLIWIGIGFILILISSKFFHRFDFKVKEKSTNPISDSNTINKHFRTEIHLSKLSSIIPNYSIFPLIKCEFLMMLRKGSKWWWLLNIAGIIVLIFTPVNTAHQIILPILWFLQVYRWSDLTSKEKYHRTHFFSFVSYKPLSRLLASQMIAGLLYSIALASPLILRYIFNADINAVFSIICGSLFIISFSACLGVITRGKKLFETLFFIITYGNLNLVPFFDYFGGINRSAEFFSIILSSTLFLIIISYMVRNYEIKHLR